MALEQEDMYVNGQEEEAIETHTRNIIYFTMHVVIFNTSYVGPPFVHRIIRLIQCYTVLQSTLMPPSHSPGLRRQSEQLRCHGHKLSPIR